MRRRSIAAAALLLSQAACGDLKREWDQAQAETDAKQAHDAQEITASLAIDNGWADAVFTVTDNAFGNTIVPQTRIAGMSTQSYPDALSGHPDSPTSLTVNTMAAQTAGIFNFSEQVQQGGTLHLSFDFDSVQLVFRMTSHWE